MTSADSFASGAFGPAFSCPASRVRQHPTPALCPNIFLEQEGRALLTRLALIKPFALQIPMVMAAGVSPAAQTAIERYLIDGRARLRELVHGFLRWLTAPEGRSAAPDEAQRRFTMLRLRFNQVISDFDLFADVLVQRSEHGTGIWLSGLDAVATDALHLPGGYYLPPPVICYLDRGPGASIRRARTRLPTGGRNPVAIIRVPRERMVGSGIASSLVHEVGHQAAELLGLVPSLRLLLRGMRAKAGAETDAWALWERWLSEIVADFWSVGRVGVASTMGLMGVVSLPRPFVFRISPDDPHPSPWIRVKLSCALGEALYPHPQWHRLARLWESFYPVEGVDPERRRLFELLQSTLPALVSLLVHHRPPRLGGPSVIEALDVDQRQPDRLLTLFGGWRRFPERMRNAPPSEVFAAIGQAKIVGLLSPEQESRIVAELLSFWALRSTWEASQRCGPPERRALQGC
jgi:hypothetical protein